MNIRDMAGRNWTVTFYTDGQPLDGESLVTLRDEGTQVIRLQVSVLLGAAAEYVRIKRLEQIQRASTEELLRVPLVE